MCILGKRYTQFFYLLILKIIKLYRVNNQIEAQEVRLIGPEGENYGVMSVPEAMRLAQEAEMDLIEIGPNSKPPVAKIGDFGQFKYELNKKERKQKVGQKKTETKGIRLSLRISQHDLDFKAEKTKKFLKEGHRVQVEMFLRGRERAHAELAREVINRLLVLIPDAKIEQAFKQLGNKIILVVSSKK